MKELILKQMSGTPLDNLSSIYKTHGKTFYIKYENRKIVFELIKKKLHNKYDYYIIQTKQDLVLPYGLYAIRIVSFESDYGIDTFTAHLDNISVNKSIGINSGTEAVQIALNLLKALNFSRLYVTKTINHGNSWVLKTAAGINSVHFLQPNTFYIKTIGVRGLNFVVLESGLKVSATDKSWTKLWKL